MNSEEKFQGWAIVELMGHRRLAGMVGEQVIGGTPMLRLDVPKTENQEAFTQFYSGAAVYCITPTTEEIARAIAERSFDRPVQPYELTAIPARTNAEDQDDLPF